MAKRRYDPKTPIYKLKVVLRDIEPPIWRRFQVRENITLAGLHDYLQGVMQGWLDYHLHEFEIGDQRFGVPDHEYDDIPEMKLINESRHKLCDLVRPGHAFLYRYDFGDSWGHLITVEERLTPDADVKYPVCIGGQRHCPPEDCGGTTGYEEFLEAISDPQHEEHDSYLEWVGGSFDPEAFDLKRANDILDNIRINTRRQS
ncbi:plasmid pRiA4b ORF-3 family protein [Planctomycetota bacterium]